MTYLLSIIEDTNSVEEVDSAQAVIDIGQGVIQYCWRMEWTFAYILWQKAIISKVDQQL